MIRKILFPTEVPQNYIRKYSKTHFFKMLVRKFVQTSTKIEARFSDKKTLNFKLEVIPAAGFCRSGRYSNLKITQNRIFCMEKREDNKIIFLKGVTKISLKKLF
jgi:hypothetical protein